MKNLLYLVIIISLFSCSNSSSGIEKNSFSHLSDSLEVKNVSIDSNAVYPQIFNHAFSNNYHLKTKEFNYTFNIDTIGNLDLPTGKLVAIDPINIGIAEAFTQEFPKGSFPLELSKTQKGYVAFARLNFKESKITKWKYALLKGETEIAITDTSAFYCFGVDAGAACLFDNKHLEKAKNINHKNWINNFFLKAPKYNSHIINKYGISSAILSTGYGDGCYATYIGYNKIGDPVQLIIDFGIVEWWKNSL